MRLHIFFLNLLYCQLLTLNVLNNNMNVLNKINNIKKTLNIIKMKVVTNVKHTMDDRNETFNELTSHF
jgi:hypothetical protein